MRIMRTRDLTRSFLFETNSQQLNSRNQNYNGNRKKLPKKDSSAEG